MRCMQCKRTLLIALCVLFGLSIMLPASAMEKQKAVVIVTGSAIYASPSLSGILVAEVSRGAEVTVLDYRNKFYAVKYGKDEGYMSECCLRLKGISESIEAKGIINADEVNLRLNPTLDAQIIVVLKKGAAVQVSSKIDNWYEVDTGKNKGYVHADYVDVPEEALAVAYSALRMGMTGKDVMRLQEALKAIGLYKGSASGSYGALTREAVKAYQQAKGLQADGIATGEMQQMLYGQLNLIDG